MYRKCGFTKINVQKAWFIVKAHDYHGIVYKKQGTKITSTKKYGIAMVNVQNAWYNHCTSKSTVLPWYPVEKTRYYQTGVHKKHSITRVTHKQILYFFGTSYFILFYSNIIIFYVDILLQLFLQKKKNKIINSEK